MSNEPFLSDSDEDNAVGPRMGTRREPCAVCGMPVFLAEKLVISRTPYHRTCFRCARCNNQLTPGNYYETEDGEYCCETCPDEEEKKSSSSGSVPICHQAYNEAMIIGRSENVKPKNFKQPEVYQRSLSDEEKTERRAQFAGEILDGSTKIVRSFLARDETIDDQLITEDKPSRTAQMRLSFMTNHLMSENYEETTDNSSCNDEESSIGGNDEALKMRINDSSPLHVEDSQRNRRDPKGALINTIISDKSVNVTDKKPFQSKNNDNSIKIEADVEISDFSDSVSNVAPVASKKSDNLDVGLGDKESYEIKMTKSFDTANEEEAKRSNNNYSQIEDSKISIRQDTKDKIGPDINVEASMNEDTRVDAGESLSLVRRRLRMFEGKKIDEISREESTVNSSASMSSEERNIDVSGTISERENDAIVDERMKKLEISSMNDSTIVEEEKKTIEGSVSSIETPMRAAEIVPPVVPKRTNLRARRDERLDVKKSDVTVLNASGIDLSEEEIYPKDLNPFGSDEENNEKAGVDESHDKSRSSRISTNPFGSSEEDEEEEEEKMKCLEILVPPRPATRSIGKFVEQSREETEDDVNEAPTKRRLKAPQINFNPFWSDDDEDHESEDEQEAQNQSLTVNTPVPKPRTIRQTGDSLLSPWKNDLSRGEFYASNSSLASTGSTSTTGGTCRKKKPAPPPPIVKELFTHGGESLPSSVTYTGSNNSLRTTPRGRKAKPAPPPPMPTSTPCGANLIANMTIGESPITNSDKIIESRDYEIWKDPKNGKDEANRNKRSMTTLSCDETSPYDAYTDKSVQGKWKRKKGPAPARPIPHRRKIKVMSLKDVKLELDEIEMQQQGLEKQGVRLEQLIRDKAETGNATEETSLGMDVEELVLELFALVNEKNELFRRQAELMLLRRQQRLEEEHADIEYQIRCLLCQPEATKTDFDKQREETLIQRLVEIVERRNEIVECLEMDRRREVEEDRSINTQMGIYAAKNKGEFAKELEEDENNRSRKSKKAKLKEKAKEKILRKVHKKDADKDVDETEVKLKRQNKKKWF